jgi:hypothetical protein
MVKKQDKENARFHMIMVTEELTRVEAARIMQTSKSAVDQWLRPRKLETYRKMPDHYLRLLEFELGLRQPSYTRAQREKRNERHAPIEDAEEEDAAARHGL